MKIMPIFPLAMAIAVTLTLSLLDWAYFSISTSANEVLWHLMPYGVFLLISISLNYSQRPRLPNSIVYVLIGIEIIARFNTMLGQSSTAGLAMLFFPLWQTIVVLIFTVYRLISGMKNTRRLR